MSSEPSLDLKPLPDGLGWIYGTLTDAAGEAYRINIMPPQSEWRGGLDPGEGYRPHPADWVVYIDGEEAGRVQSGAELTLPFLLSCLVA